MMISSQLSTYSSKALPITLNEFTRVLHVGPKARVAPFWPVHRTIGLAISGGVDSMALASLCAKVQKSRGLKFQAFVVDHDARSGSYDEAKMVSQVLLEMGIDTEILRIRWAEDIIPLSAPNFESLARTHRFQALGRACRDHGILRLLLAHHADDQAETIMMRLAGGHGIRGLAGIGSDAPIPECYGIYGVHNSGLEQTRTKLWSRVELRRTMLSNDEIVRQFAKTHLNNPKQKPMRNGQFEAGGVRVVRPLLKFRKERLIATCLANDTPWFEDPTNKDRTMTPRNAIRHIFKHHSLPVAIQKESLVKLSIRVRKRKLMALTEARSMLYKYAEMDFEPLVGTLTIGFPKSPFLWQCNGEDRRTLHHPIDQHQLAAEILRMAIESITPEEHVHVSSLSGVCRVIFPELYSAKDQVEQLAKSFTIGGVQFERQEGEIPPQNESKKASMDQVGDTPGHAREAQLRGQKWLITRQPHPSNISKHPLLEIPSPQRGQPPEWKLYDGRHWMRISNFTADTMKVRPLRREDLHSFRAELDEPDRRRLGHLLHDLAPGRVRFTLPAIAMHTPSGGERVVALPTLDVGVPGVDEMLDWVVRYKHVVGPFERAANGEGRSTSAGLRASARPADGTP